MNQTNYAKNIETIWDMIDYYQALDTIIRTYPNDPVDVDKEGCFV